MPRKHDCWIGLVVSLPEIGMPLMIGRPGARDFRVTSPVTVVLNRADGMLVHTAGSRYLVGISGNTYLVSKHPEELVESDQLPTSA